MTENSFKTETITQVELFAGDHPVISIPAAIVSGSGVLTRGTVLGRVTASGKYKPYLSTNNDGSEVPRAVLVRDIDASLEDAKVTVYIHGEFNKNALAGIDTAAILKLQEFGIYVKEVK